MASGWFVTAGEVVSSKTVGGTLNVGHYSGTGYDNVLAATKFPTPLAWGPYSTEAQADAEKATLDKSPPASVQTTPKTDPNLSISGFLSALGQRNTWLRVLKVVIGVVLVIVGLVQLTHAQKLIETAGEAAAMA